FACPGKNQRQKLPRDFRLIVDFLLLVRSVFVVGFVPEVPAENAVILSECSDDAFDVGFQARTLGGVGKRGGPGTLDPPGVVHAGNRSVLLAAIARNVLMRFWKPAASCCQSKSCRKTRIVLSPMDSAQPSSKSMRWGSKLSACHISSWLMALAGM